MKFMLTYEARQLSETEYVRELPADEDRELAGHPTRLHIAFPSDVVNADILYTKVDHSIRGRSHGAVFYDALTTLSPHWEGEVRDWISMLAAISRKCLGASLNDVEEDPECYVGLPLWSLVLFVNHDVLFPPHLIPVLVADLNNLTTDGGMRDLKTTLKREGLDQLFDKTVDMISYAHAERGSFYYED